MSGSLEHAVEVMAGETPTEGSTGQEARRTLGVWHGVALYVGSVLGTGVLVLPAIAADTAGPASLLAWAALLVLSGPLALTYAALSIQRPDAGGFSDAIERAFGRRWGGVAGWLFLAQVPTGTVVVALIAGQYGASAFGGGPMMVAGLGIGLVVLGYTLNYVGLRVSAMAQLVTLGVIATGLALIVGRALPHVEPHAFTPFFSRGPAAVGLAAVQLFWAFVGWEAITPLAREFRNPRDIWRSSVLSVAIVGVLYLGLAVAVIGTRAHGSSGGSIAPLVLLAERVSGTRASTVVGIAGFLLSFIPLNAYIAGTSRLMFALGERGQLPRWLGVMSPDGTPRRAIVALGLIVGAALVAALAWHAGLDDLLPLSTSSFIATYVLSMAAAVRLLRGPILYAAIVSLAACVGILLFVGPLIGWIAGVSACALAYQSLSARGGAVQKEP
ncbi:APC family permease [Hyalangium versicolor]|uniref:APC family permease n=1 Tax=Hyalangium versicolor TaxID=2861190 RepID=UPI001CC97290|nr:amino acid permease [Hyalangium versicolor]